MIIKQTKRQKLNIDTEDIAARVLSNEQLWIPRSNHIPFYTIGRAAYLDGKTPEYLSESLERNAALMELFPELYVEVLAYLSRELKEPVYLATDLAIPGFHIFKSNPAFLQSGGEWHIDYPHITLGLGSVDHSTFTVPVMLPTGGAGLDRRGIDGEEYYLPYREGVIVWQVGLEDHRLAKLHTYIPNEYRITLQGHLIRRDGDMEVFF